MKNFKYLLLCLIIALAGACVAPPAAAPAGDSGGDAATSEESSDDAAAEEGGEALEEITVAYFLEWPTPNQVAQVEETYDEAMGLKVNWVSFDTGVAENSRYCHVLRRKRQLCGWYRHRHRHRQRNRSTRSASGSANWYSCSLQNVA